MIVDENRWLLEQNQNSRFSNLLSSDEQQSSNINKRLAQTHRPSLFTRSVTNHPAAQQSRILGYQEDQFSNSCFRMSYFSKSKKQNVVVTGNKQIVSILLWTLSGIVMLYLWNILIPNNCEGQYILKKCNDVHPKSFRCLTLQKCIESPYFFTTEENIILYCFWLIIGIIYQNTRSPIKLHYKKIKTT